MYGNAMRGIQHAPPPFVPQMPGGFNPGQVSPVGMPGAMGGPGQNQGGGWLGAIRGALGDLTGMEQMYLGASALGGVSDWWEGRQDRKFRERVYDEGREDDINHRRRMGQALNRAWG